MRLFAHIAHDATITMTHQVLCTQPYTHIARVREHAPAKHKATSACERTQPHTHLAASSLLLRPIASSVMVWRRLLFLSRTDPPAPLVALLPLPGLLLC